MRKIKKSIVFLHGLLGTKEDLTGLMDYFSEDIYETYSFNFSGHGLHAKETKEFRIELFAQDLDRFLNENQLKNPIVFGHSIGGYVGLYHKAHFENSPIKEIFTYGTRFNWNENSLKKDLLMLNPDYLSDKHPQLCHLFKKKHGDRWQHLLLLTAHLIQNLEKTDGLTKEDMAEIEIPIIMMIGDQDKNITKEETFLASTWPRNSQTKTVSHSKHELDRSNLKEISEIIKNN